MVEMPYLGSANALTRHSRAGVPEMGRSSQFCSWKERAVALNRAFSLSDKLRSFNVPTAAL